MCGICGFYGFNDLHLIKRMTHALEHRGPEQFGYFIDYKISLGHRRLKIIDLSEKGKQPIFNEDKSICVVYNGEIYNYKKIREELEKKGHKFDSNTDTEVIVHAYEEYGESCLNKFNGMWGLAIWDSTEKKLFIAVDRLGIKQIYYTKTKDKFLFGSEIKAILQDQEIKRAVNYDALSQYLTFRYTPFDETLFEGVKKLLPGHYLTYKNNKVEIKKYWDINSENFEPEKNTEKYYQEKVHNLLKNAVQKRLMSDVPLGAYLSGGLDSSIIVGLMSEVSDNVKTFTVGFEAQEPYNEMRYAKMVAEHFNTEHYPLMVKADAASVLPKAIWHLDEPVSDPTVIAQYLISELTKKHVTVVLTGEGADELFCGYTNYKVMMKTEKYKKFLPEFARKKIIPKIVNSTPDKVLDKFFKYASSFGEKGKERFSDYMSSLDKREESFLLLQSVFDEHEKRKVYGEKLIAKENNLDYVKEKLTPYFKDITGTNYLNKIVYLDLKTRLPHYLLHKIDKMTMAHAIEARVPFIDYELVEFSFKIPAEMKSRAGGKYILKKIMEKKLPKQILKRQKQPFLVPLNKWYEEKLKGLAPNIFENSDIFREKYFKQKAMTNITENYEKSKFYYGRQIWTLLTFAIWHKIYIENDNMSKPNLDINKFL
jgi:asparagine synthase (glutamine-hydrolysing)